MRRRQQQPAEELYRKRFPIAIGIQKCEIQDDEAIVRIGRQRSAIAPFGLLAPARTSMNITQVGKRRGIIGVQAQTRFQRTSRLLQSSACTQDAPQHPVGIGAIRLLSKHLAK